MPEIIVSFKNTAARKIERLARDRSESDVLREALALEEIYQEALEEGSTVVIRTKNGTEREIVRG